MTQISLGGIEYRIVASEHDAQWVARDEQIDTATPFGIETAGTTQADAIEVQKKSLDAVEAARISLDQIRARQPS